MLGLAKERSDWKMENAEKSIIILMLLALKKEHFIQNDWINLFFPARPRLEQTLSTVRSEKWRSEK